MTNIIHILNHKACLLHEMGQEHPESPLRIQAIFHELQSSQLTLQWEQTRKIDIKILQKSHSLQYIQTIMSAIPVQKYHSIGADAVMNPYTVDAALYAAGSAIDAVDNVYQHNAKIVFCLVRPPGHHAEQNKAMGFCFFNNVAAGVSYAFEKYHVPRIAIVDFDVHHGNGTQDILQNNPNVLFCSSFQHPFYPFSPVIESHPVIVHMPVAAGTSGQRYRQQFTKILLPRLEEFKPNLLFVSAGFDAHKFDPLGGLNLDETDYFWLGEKLATLAATYCDSRIISLLEGGYHLQALAKSVHSYLKGIDSINKPTQYKSTPF